MSEKTFNTLTKVQKILLLIMAVASVTFEIVIVINAKTLDNLNLKVAGYNVAATNLAFAAAMICGYIYANKGYTKDAGNFYKAMMAFYALTNIFPAVTLFRMSGFNLASVVNIIKFVLLIVLAFGKDLGQKNTWIIFAIVFILELLYAPLSIMAVAPTNAQLSLGSYISTAISRLVLAGLLGLCIVAKYRDKAARGSK